jgi:hypothetical protein
MSSLTMIASGTVGAGYIGTEIFGSAGWCVQRKRFNGCISVLQSEGRGRKDLWDSWGCKIPGAEVVVDRIGRERRAETGLSDR